MAKRGGPKPQTSAVQYKMSPEILGRLREKVREHADLPSHIERARKIQKDFPEFTMNTLKRYVVVAWNLTDFLFGLYREDKLPWTTLNDLCTANLDAGMRDYLGQEAYERKMSNPQLLIAIEHARRGKSAFECVERAMGTIKDDPHGKRAEKTDRDFSTMVKDISRIAQDLRVNVSMAMELIPESALKEKSHSMFRVFREVYMLRHVLGESYEFVDKRVKSFLDTIEKFVASQADLSARRVKNGQDESGRQASQVR